MMEEPSENLTAENIKSEVNSTASLGTMLREAREHMGLSVIDVANQIKFAPRQIESLEADEFKNLHEDAFLRGFVRSYAKILQLDAERFFVAVPQTKVARAERKGIATGAFHATLNSIHSKNSKLLIAAALLAVAAGVFGLWNFISPPEQNEKTQVDVPVSFSEEKVDDSAEQLTSNDAAEPIKSKVISQPTAMQPAQTKVKPKQKPEPKPAIKAITKIKPEAKPALPPLNQVEIPVSQPAITVPATQIRLEFDVESWTEIKDREGAVLSSQINQAGSELIIYGQAPFTMLIANGLSTRLFHQGKQVDLTPFINKYSEVAHVTLR